MKNFHGTSCFHTKTQNIRLEIHDKPKSCAIQNDIQFYLQILEEVKYKFYIVTKKLSYIKYC